jgi:ABC-2 type transport system permease protein
MSAPHPHPGFLSGFVPTLRRSLATTLPGKKALILMVVLVIPPLLWLPVMDESPEHRGEVLMAVLLFLYLQFLAPVSGLLFGTGIILDEAGSGNLPFLFTRPAPRSSIVLGKFVAALLVGTAALTVSLAATLALSSGAEVREGLAGRAFLAVLLAFPAYLAAFAFLGALTRWALLGGFLYAFGLEGFLGFIPGMVRQTTLLHYSRSLLGEWEARKVTMELLTRGTGPAETGTAVTVLLGVTVAFVLLTLFVTSKRQFAARNPGRA